MNTEIYEVEITDTFGGEANYSWVKRERIEVPVGTSDLAIVRLAKQFFGLTGLRTKNESYGDQIVRDFQPAGLCQIMFITYLETKN